MLHSTKLISILFVLIASTSCEPKSYRVKIDDLTMEYLKAEQSLWSKLRNDKNLFLEIRSNLLPEIYDIHRFWLSKDFGETGAIWELGLRLHEKTITLIIGINGTAGNLQHALQNNQYEGALAIAEVAINQSVEAAKILYQTATQTTFWNHISLNVSDC